MSVKSQRIKFRSLIREKLFAKIREEGISLPADVKLEMEFPIEPFDSKAKFSISSKSNGISFTDSMLIDEIISKNLSEIIRDTILELFPVLKKRYNNFVNAPEKSEETIRGAKSILIY